MKNIAWKKTTTSVTSAAALLGVASLVSRLVGIVRDRILSGTFGAGAELDVYYAAFRAPDLLYNLLVFGAISAGFIPIFTKYLHGKDDKQGEESAWDLAAGLFSLMTLSLVVLSVIGVVFAHRFVPLMAPGFSEAQIQSTVQLTRIMFLSPVFLGLSSVFGGILQTYRRFFVYAVAPIFYNVGIIFGILVLSDSMGIAGAAFGVVIGAFLHMLIQMVACSRIGPSFRFIRGLRHSGLLSVGKMMIPRTLALAITQINLIVITIIASTLGAGGISIFNLANNLQSFPIGILGVSFAIAAFPLISELAVKEKFDEFADAVAKTTTTILYLIIPATIVFLLLRAQIVRVILGSGNFDWNDTIATADTLGFFTLSLFAQALIPLIARSFFALEDVRTPLFTGLIAVVCERIIAWKFIAMGLGTPGLALAFSIGSVINISLLWAVLRFKTGGLREGRILRALLPMCIGGMVMAFFMQMTKIAMAEVVDMQTFMGILGQGFAAGTVGVVMYIGVTHALGSEEARQIVQVYKRKLSFAKNVVAVRNDDVIDT